MWGFFFCRTTLSFLLASLFLTKALAHSAVHDLDHDHAPIHHHNAQTLFGSGRKPHVHLTRLQSIVAANELAATMGAVGAVSGLSLLLVSLLPEKLPKHVLNVLVAFAVGSIIGDVFLHGLDEVFGSHDGHRHGHHEQSKPHSHSHETKVGLTLLAGLLGFFVLERVVALLGMGHHHNHHEEEHREPEAQETRNESETLALKADGSQKGLRQRRKVIKGQDNQPHNHDNDHDQHHSSHSNLHFSLVPFMVSSTLHSLTDGLNLSLTFLASPASALSTSIAILCHEVPHRIGDYSILIRNGFSKWRSLGILASCAMGTFAGALLGHVLAKNPQIDVDISTLKILTVSGMIYMGFCGVMPELRESSGRGFKGLIELCLQVLGMTGGVLLMKSIAENE